MMNRNGLNLIMFRKSSTCPQRSLHFLPSILSKVERNLVAIWLHVCSYPITVFFTYSKGGFSVDLVMRMNLQDIYQERELVLVVIKVELILLEIKLGLIFVEIKLGLAS